LVTINRKKVSAGIAIIVIVLIFPWTCLNTQAQTDITFNPADKFSIPSYNGTISFAVNGTYSKATLENDTWTFTNLRLNRSQPLENFKISTQNSNVTIFSYLAFNTTLQSARLRYAVEGKGKQIFNFGLVSQGGEWSGVDWSVITGNNVFIAEGEGWTISNDGTLIVTGATGNVSIVHWGFFENSLPSSNLPFYQQHSVAIAAAMVVAITVIVAIVIKVKSRGHSGEK
jgi:hypothetical protein